MIAEQLEVCHCVESLRWTGMSRCKHWIAFLGPCRRPWKEVLHDQRLVILIDAKQRHIEAISGEGEIVRIAAEERNVEFGGEHQTHVGELLVLIEVVLRALIERDNFALQSVLCLRVL